MWQQVSEMVAELANQEDVRSSGAATGETFRLGKIDSKHGTAMHNLAFEICGTHSRPAAYFPMQSISRVQKAFQLANQVLDKRNPFSEQNVRGACVVALEVKWEVSSSCT